MSQCDLCGRNEVLTTQFTIYSARSAGPGMTTRESHAALPNQVIVSTLKPYKEFVTHAYVICKRCSPSRFMKIMTVYLIGLIVSVITLGVIVALYKKSLTALQFFTGFAIILSIVFAIGLGSHFVDPAKRLKRKAKRSRGKAFEFGAWTEKEFEQAFGKQKPN